MLQEIIEKMYIDPDLLEELSDEQKAILFYKMRQEQVRRWKEEENKHEERKKPTKPSKAGIKNVSFMHGKDGKEWVWVMGDHRNDRTIQQILDDEAQRNADKQADIELEKQRMKEEKEFQRKIDEEQRRLEREKAEREAELKRKEEEAALYASLKEAREAAKRLEEEKMRSEEEVTLRVNDLRKKFALERRKSMERVETNKKRRSSELYMKWKHMRDSIDKQALETSKEVEPIWKEQEKRAKDAEVQMRQLARDAREEVRNSFRHVARNLTAVSAFASGKDKPPLPPKEDNGNSEKIKAHKRKSRPPRPQNKDAIIAWFHDEERERSAGLDPQTNKPAEWFHGIIPRMDAETMLINEPTGSYLVRVSERVWGYTISYRASDRCKHFLVDTTENGYQFFGTNQIKHATLADLILYHVNNHITVAGKEMLIKPIGQIKSPPDYYDLFKNRRSESTSL
ncbi:SH2 domain-containing protein 4B-like isoform X3 [Mytilus californianus]|uniref:SH2 domain-containing protein 4B-like isoform X3 n=1 Tax=Mytilus californianus TaxID=6549 RepID=UPI002247FB81|nr:SH2 domain-containing protein 4B-like isoform X3 [Mytilus californianus]